MFLKVVVAEDIDSINLTLGQVLQQSGVQQIQHCKYCEEALNKLRQGLAEGAPYDLLVTDLSFKADFKDTAVTSGEFLIREAKKLQPDLKILVYSIEDKAYTITRLFQEEDIDAYVVKGRHSLTELRKALEVIYEGRERFLSPDYAHLLQDRTIHEIDGYDLELLRQLSLGVRQDALGERLQTLGVKPYSKSAVEKRIKLLREYLKADTTVQLMAIAKDLGLV